MDDPRPDRLARARTGTPQSRHYWYRPRGGVTTSLDTIPVSFLADAVQDELAVPQKGRTHRARTGDGVCALKVKVNGMRERKSSKKRALRAVNSFMDYS